MRYPIFSATDVLTAIERLSDELFAHRRNQPYLQDWRYIAWCETSLPCSLSQSWSDERCRYRVLVRCRKEAAGVITIFRRRGMTLLRIVLGSGGASQSVWCDGSHHFRKYRRMSLKPFSTLPLSVSSDGLYSLKKGDMRTTSCRSFTVLSLLNRSMD